MSPQMLPIHTAMPSITFLTARIANARPAREMKVFEGVWDDLSGELLIVQFLTERPSVVLDSVAAPVDLRHDEARPSPFRRERGQILHT